MHCSSIGHSWQSGCRRRVAACSSSRKARALSAPPRGQAAYVHACCAALTCRLPARRAEERQLHTDGGADGCQHSGEAVAGRHSAPGMHVYCMAAARHLDAAHPLVTPLALHACLTTVTLCCTGMRQLAEASERLTGLKAGSRLVTAEERSKVEGGFAACQDAWGKRRRMFKAIWCRPLLPVALIRMLTAFPQISVCLGLRASLPACLLWCPDEMLNCSRHRRPCVVMSPSCFLHAPGRRGGACALGAGTR